MLCRAGCHLRKYPEKTVKLISKLLFSVREREGKWGDICNITVTHLVLIFFRMKQANQKLLCYLRSGYSLKGIWECRCAGVHNSYTLILGYFAFALSLVTYSAIQSSSAIYGPGRTTRIKLPLMLFSKRLLHDNVFPIPQQTFYFSCTHERYGLTI